MFLVGHVHLRKVKFPTKINLDLNVAKSFILSLKSLTKSIVLSVVKAKAEMKKQVLKLKILDFLILICAVLHISSSS